MKGRLVSVTLAIVAGAGIVRAMNPKTPPAIVSKRSSPRIELARSEQTIRKLDVRVSHIRFASTSLDDAIDRIRTEADVNIFVDWVSLERVGLRRTSPVNLDLHDVTYAQALFLVLPSMYTFNDGTVVVGEPIFLGRAWESITMVYDVRDLLHARAAWLNQPGRRSNANSNPIAELKGLILNQFLNSITHSYRDPPIIQEVNGRFVINQSAEDHMVTADLLDDLRYTGPRPRYNPRKLEQKRALTGASG